MHSVFLLKSTSSLKSSQGNNPISILIIVSMIFALLFGLLIIALPAFEEPFEEDTPFVEIALIGERNKLSFTRTIPLSFELGVLILSMRLEFLRGRIGEKRFVDSHSEFNNSLFLFCCIRRLYLRAALLLFRSSAKSSPEIVLLDFVQRKLFLKEFRKYARDYPIKSF